MSARLFWKQRKNNLVKLRSGVFNKLRAQKTLRSNLNRFERKRIMKTVTLKHFAWIMALAVIYSACKPGTEYDQLKKAELAKGKRVDSLFFGIHLGMTSKAFFARCWELNKQGVFTDGSNNSAVLYKLKTELKHPASMNFYPDFIDGKISRMKVSYQYDGWAPWNKTLWADSLLPDVMQLFSKWYPGNDFITMTNANKQTIHVKIDGNRRITVGRFNDYTVKADIADLLVEPETKK